MIGFDAILDAQSLSPSLTTIRHPTFSLGYQSVITLLDHICADTDRAEYVVVPPRLITRQSCGCQADGNSASLSSTSFIDSALQLDDLSHMMAEASLMEARKSLFEDLQGQCMSFLNAFLNRSEISRRKRHHERGQAHTCLECTFWGDVIHLEKAQSLVNFEQDYYAEGPAITHNTFGNGNAFYVGTAPDKSGMEWLIEHVYKTADVKPASANMPAGVEILHRVNGKSEFMFILNHLGQKVSILFEGYGHDLLTYEKNNFIHHTCSAYCPYWKYIHDPTE